MTPSTKRDSQHFVRKIYNDRPFVKPYYKRCGKYYLPLKKEHDFTGRKFVFFDCDGNIVDSEILAMAIAADYITGLAKKQGIKVDRERIIGMFGKTTDEMAEIIAQETGFVYTEENRKEIIKLTIDGLKDRTQAIEGVKEHLTFLVKHDITPIIVTSSAMERVVPSLKAANLYDFFKEEYSIFSAATHCPKGHTKPRKTVYQMALNTLGLNPTDTYTSEDSIGSGLGSAKGAGIPCYGNVMGKHITSKDAHALKMIQNGAAGVLYNWKEAEKLLYLVKPVGGFRPRFTVNRPHTKLTA